jgi:hypothetical protein
MALRIDTRRICRMTGQHHQPSGASLLTDEWWRNLINKPRREPPTTSGNEDLPPWPEDPCPALSNRPGPRCNIDGAAALLTPAE